MGLPNEIVAGLIGGKKQYQIERSLRFNDDDSAYLSRTPGSASNRKTWTWSGWVKRGNLGSTQYFFSTVGSSSDATTFSFTFTNTDALSVGQWNFETLRTTAVYRDPSAWYHVVLVLDTTQATAADRLKLYVNGSQITVFSTDNRASNAQNSDLGVNLNQAHAIGRNATGSNLYYDGYMAEIHFIDGTALTPSSFGETDISTGTWIPKKYTGTYGTNGFYLPFSDNTSTTTLGDDSSGNNNDWTLNNFSVTAGAENDSLEDTPTNNWSTLNPISKNGTGAFTYTNGNLQVVVPASNQSTRGTIGVSSGKWYWEAELTTLGNAYLGLVGSNAYNASYVPTPGLGVNNAGQIFFNGSNIGLESIALAAGGAIYGMAVDIDAGKFWWSKNGQWYSGDVAPDVTISISDVESGLRAFAFTPTAAPEWHPLFGTSTASSTHVVNFGQRPFVYTPPTGFKALNIENLPTPSIKNPSKYMNVTTWTGNGNTRSITGIGFQPDLVWTKSRSNAEDHKLVDSSRTAGRALESNTTDDEVIEAGISSFDSDGFTIDGTTDAGYNTNTYTYVGWTWKKGIVPGFDIVTYTGNGTARTIPHSLGIAPHFMIVKARSTASTNQGWPVYHRNNTTAPETDYLLLNSAAATADLDTIWNDTAPTGSVFSVGTNALVNTNNDTYVAYLFTEISGFSKFGSYTGNGSADGPFVFCGFRPRFVLLKPTTVADSWRLQDMARDPENPTDATILPNSSSAEVVSAANYAIDFLSNGFKLRTSAVGHNQSGVPFVFAAFAEHPFKYPRAR